MVDRTGEYVLYMYPFSTLTIREKGDKPRRYAICRPLLHFENVVWESFFKKFF